jgi:isochorismate hydrolase
MTDVPNISKKEEYVTLGDLKTKSTEWMNEIEFNAKNRNRFRFKPESAALLVIDMQRYFTDFTSHAYIPSSKAILGNIKNLIDAFRMTNLAVIFTRHSLDEDEDPGIMGRWWGDTIRRGDPLSQLDSNLIPLEREVVIQKTRYNAFSGTKLHENLKNLGIKSVVITGVMTHLCCETTAREAFTRDYEVYFVVDGTATQTEELHISSLRTISNGFAIPVLTDEILKEISGSEP